MANVYDLPVKYNKAARAYVVEKQRRTTRNPGCYEVTLEHGDRALPQGFVASVAKTMYHTYMFTPGHAGSYAKAILVGKSSTMQEAIEDVRKAFEQRI
jgi:hypothetical protein